MYIGSPFEGEIILSKGMFTWIRIELQLRNEIDLRFIWIKLRFMLGEMMIVFKMRSFIYVHVLTFYEDQWEF